MKVSMYCSIEFVFSVTNLLKMVKRSIPTIKATDLMATKLDKVKQFVNNLQMVHNMV